MIQQFLLIGKIEQARWPQLLQSALSSLGSLHTAREEEAIQAATQVDYDLIVIDAGMVHNPADLTRRLVRHRPGTRVIVATASPTWTRAREAFQAGAAEYMRKTLDEKKLRARIEEVLTLPPPQQIHQNGGTENG